MNYSLKLNQPKKLKKFKFKGVKMSKKFFYTF